MSRKFVNILATINIIFGLITIFGFNQHSLASLSATVDKTLYMNIVYDTCKLVMFFSITLIIKFLRENTSRGRIFKPKKKHILELLSLLAGVIILNSIVYIISILFMEYGIKRLEIYKAFPFAVQLTYILSIGFAIYFICLHFPKD
ncbi:MAG: hypothetical protein Q4D02_07585 [Clostridia bacterium]|nr:hypothetical protein [Clostridia bacterium]